MSTKAEVESTTWNFLRTKGFSEKVTASIMGNIYMESGFDPNVVEAQNGIGLGLCQWSYGRRTQLEAYGTDLNHQLEFLYSEVTGKNTSMTGANLQYFSNGYLSLSAFLSGVDTVDSLTESFCFSWERPAVATAHLAERQTAANGYLAQFTGGAVIPPTGGTTSEAMIIKLQLFLNSVKITDNSGSTLTVSGIDSPQLHEAVLSCKQVIKAIMESGKV